MKITGGVARGIRIQAPTGTQTRPTTDRVRESLFGILRDWVPGARVWDLFAGSGALGLEAASRGATEVIWVEKHGPTCGLIRQNLEKLPAAGVTAKMRVARGDVFSWLRAEPVEVPELILADPPYADLSDAAGLHRFLQALASAGCCGPETIVVLETPARLRADIPELWQCLRRETYGTTAVWLLSQDADSAVR